MRVSMRLTAADWQVRQVPPHHEAEADGGEVDELRRAIQQANIEGLRARIRNVKTN